MVPVFGGSAEVLVPAVVLVEPEDEAGDGDFPATGIGVEGEQGVHVLPLAASSFLGAAHLVAAAGGEVLLDAREVRRGRYLSWSYSQAVHHYMSVYAAIHENILLIMRYRSLSKYYEEKSVQPMISNVSLAYLDGYDSSTCWSSRWCRSRSSSSTSTRSPSIWSPSSSPTGSASTASQASSRISSTASTGCIIHPRKNI